MSTYFMTVAEFASEVLKIDKSDCFLNSIDYKVLNQHNKSTSITQERERKKKFSDQK